MINNKELITLLEKDYSLGNIVSHRVLRDGIDNRVYDISTENGDRFIVRENKRSFEYKNLDFEIELNDFLTKNKFKTPRLIKTNEGKGKVEKGGLTFLLFEYILGSQFEKIENITSQESLIETGGELLGRLHKETVSLRMKNDPIRTIFTEFERFIKVPKKDVSLFKGSEKLTKEINYFVDEGKRRINRNDFIGVIHNDYYMGNLIYKNKEDCYLIDFDWSCNGPLIKDVALGVGAWSSSFDGKKPPNKEVVSIFLSGYNKYSPLRVDYDDDLIFWICFSFLSEAATFFVDVLEERWPEFDIREIEQCFSYRKFQFFFREFKK